MVELTDTTAVMDVQGRETTNASTRLLALDILRGDSRIVAEGDRAIIAELPFVHLPDGTLNAPIIVSRKKRLVPAVLAAVQQR